MAFSLSISEANLAELTAAIFAIPGLEGAAYVLCGISATDNETRLLAKSIVPVSEGHYLVRQPFRLSISSSSYVPIAKRARLKKEAVLFVHSHPENYPDFSPQDDEEEPALMSFFHARAPGAPHGSLVFSSPTAVQGRIFDEGSWNPIERVRILGRRFRFIDHVNDQEPLPEFFDRQVLAFGPDIQRLLRRLHIGVVGAGGTGSAVIEQLTRLGVGTISVFDGQTLDKSNVTRVYGSALSDEGRPKAEIQEKHVRRIGLGTEIIVYPDHITQEAIAKKLRGCDLVFGCTDKQSPRGILVRLSLRYLIPVFDMAVKIEAEEQTIRGIWGRVTTLLPGEACLFCRGRIEPGIIRAEGLPPTQRDQEIAEGYINVLDTDEPAVVMFTSAVSAQAISEMLHRLTGFMGSERESTETLMFFHEGRIRTNRTPGKPDCLCQIRENWGRGDTDDFLGRVW